MRAGDEPTRRGEDGRMNQSEQLIEMGYGHGTNRVCAEYVTSSDYCGCRRCGHLRDEHPDG